MGGRGNPARNGLRQIPISEEEKRLEIEKIITESNAIRSKNSDGDFGAPEEKLLYKKCACCGAYTIPVDTTYHKCSTCGWIDDPIQNKNPDSREGRNPISLNEAKFEYSKRNK